MSDKPDMEMANPAAADDIPEWFRDEAGRVMRAAHERGAQVVLIAMTDQHSYELSSLGMTPMIRGDLYARLLRAIVGFLGRALEAHHAHGH